MGSRKDRVSQRMGSLRGSCLMMDSVSLCKGSSVPYKVNNETPPPTPQQTPRQRAGRSHPSAASTDLCSSPASSRISASKEEAEVLSADRRLGSGLLCGLVPVILRIRPFSNRESREGDVDCVEIVSTKQIRISMIDFTMDTVLDDRGWLYQNNLFGSASPETASQEVTFEAVGQRLVTSALSGYNCCLYAFGATGTGKTASIFGNHRSSAGQGVLPRTVEAIFHALCEEASDTEGAGCFQARVSYFEIFNERIRDLLVPPNMQLQTPLEVRQHPKLGVFVEGLTSSVAESFEDVLEFLDFGASMRAVWSGSAGSRSARTSCIFVLSFERVTEDNNHMHVSVQFSDLAGSEQLIQELNSNSSKGTSSSTKKSLSHLSSFVWELSQRARKASNRGSTPGLSRDCKLSALLSYGMSGNCLASVLTTLSPAASNEAQSLATLRFATMVREIRTRPRSNAFETRAEVTTALNHEIQVARTHLAGQKISMASEIDGHLSYLESLACYHIRNWAEERRASRALAASQRAALSEIGMSFYENEPQCPYLANISDDPFLQGCLLCLLRPGEQLTIGTSESNCIRLPASAAEGLQPHMCVLWNDEDAAQRGHEPCVSVSVLYNGTTPRRSVSASSLNSYKRKPSREPSRDRASRGAEAVTKAAAAAAASAAAAAEAAAGNWVQSSRVAVNGQRLQVGATKQLQHLDKITLGSSFSLRLVLPEGTTSQQQVYSLLTRPPLMHAEVIREEQAPMKNRMLGESDQANSFTPDLDAKMIKTDHLNMINSECSTWPNKTNSGESSNQARSGSGRSMKVSKDFTPPQRNAEPLRVRGAARSGSRGEVTTTEEKPKTEKRSLLGHARIDARGEAARSGSHGEVTQASTNSSGAYPELAQGGTIGSEIFSPKTVHHPSNPCDGTPIHRSQDTKSSERNTTGIRQVSDLPTKQVDESPFLSSRGSTPPPVVIFDSSANEMKSSAEGLSSASIPAPSLFRDSTVSMASELAKEANHLAGLLGSQQWYTEQVLLGGPKGLGGKEMLSAVVSCWSSRPSDDSNAKQPDLVWAKNATDFATYDLPVMRDEVASGGAQASTNNLLSRVKTHDSSPSTEEERPETVLTSEVSQRDDFFRFRVKGRNDSAQDKPEEAIAWEARRAWEAEEAAAREESPQSQPSLGRNQAKSGASTEAVELCTPGSLASHKVEGCATTGSLQPDPGLVAPAPPDVFYTPDFKKKNDPQREINVPENYVAGTNRIQVPVEISTPRCLRPIERQSSIGSHTNTARRFVSSPSLGVFRQSSQPSVIMSPRGLERSPSYGNRQLHSSMVSLMTINDAPTRRSLPNYRASASMIPALPASMAGPQLDSRRSFGSPERPRSRSPDALVSGRSYCPDALVSSVLPDRAMPSSSATQLALQPQPLQAMCFQPPQNVASQPVQCTTELSRAFTQQYPCLEEQEQRQIIGGGVLPAPLGVAEAGVLQPVPQSPLRQVSLSPRGSRAASFGLRPTPDQTKYPVVWRPQQQQQMPSQPQPTQSTQRLQCWRSSRSSFGGSASSRTGYVPRRAFSPPPSPMSARQYL